MMKGREVILGILRNKPQTGYEINDVLKNQISYFYDGTYGMIYPTLKKLEQEGKVVKQTIIQADKPNKNVFSITAAGKKELQTYLNSDAVAEVFKSDFLMKLFFGDNLSHSQIINLMEKEIQLKTAQINHLQSSLQQWEQEGITDSQKITVGYGLAHYTAVVDYLNQQLAAFKQ